MLALAKDWGQVELFPTATETEIKAAKVLLTRYRRMRVIVEDFEKLGLEKLTTKQIATYSIFKKGIGTIERAVSLVMDKDIKRILELRYIKGEPHKITVLYFGSMMHAATVDRKLNKGIEAVANTLKLWED